MQTHWKPNLNISAVRAMVPKALKGLPKTCDTCIPASHPSLFRVMIVQVVDFDCECVLRQPHLVTLWDTWFTTFLFFLQVSLMFHLNFPSYPCILWGLDMVSKLTIPQSFHLLCDVCVRVCVYIGVHNNMYARHTPHITGTKRHAENTTYIYNLQWKRLYIF